MVEGIGHTAERTAAAPSTDRTHIFKVRGIQLVLVALVVAAAFITKPGPSVAGEPVAELRAPVTAEDESAASTAAFVAEAVAGLLSVDETYSLPPKGQAVFGPDPSDSGQQIVDDLIDQDLLSRSDAQDITQRGLLLYLQPCEDRVGVLVTSTVQSPVASRQWWSENSCELEIPVEMAWPVHLAVAEIPDQSA